MLPLYPKKKKKKKRNWNVSEKATEALFLVEQASGGTGKTLCPILQQLFPYSEGKTICLSKTFSSVNLIH